MSGKKESVEAQGFEEKKSPFFEKIFKKETPFSFTL